MATKIRKRNLRLGILAGTLIIILGCLNSVGWSATTTEPTGMPRLKIGLALGGGSAKGFAHIGVLKWLEDNRIPVDYIAGTSMGGLIGGCYAVGMGPDEIEGFVNSIDWYQLFDPIPPYDILDFRRKEDLRDFPIEAEIGWRNKGIKLPSGLSVHQVGLILSRLTLPYSTLSNFDELPIPYRCVATDIQKAEAVVMSDGSLAEALRATMAIPGVFTPVERDGRLLVDGGVLNNLPADVVKGMGADVVIAVDLHATVQEREIEGISQVLTRTMGVVIIDNTRRSLELADIILAPQMGELKSTSWKAAQQFFDLGYQAANQQATELKKYALDEAAWQQYLLERHKRQRSTALAPKAIEVSGTTQINAEYIKDHLEGYIGKPLNTVNLETDLTDITGSGLYESLRYGYVMRDGAPVLLITAIEKPYGPPFVNFAFLLEADGIRAEHVDINARSRITYFNVTSPRSEFRFDFGFGTELQFLGELYQPIAASKWFIAPAGFIEQQNSSIFEDNLCLTDFKTTETGLRIDLGYSLSKHSEARLGYVAERQVSRVKVGEPLGADFDGMARLAQLQWTYARGEAAALPRDGFFWDLDLNWYFEAPGTSEEFGLAETKLIWERPAHKRDVVFIMLAAGTAFGDELPLPQQFSLGGPFRMGTYKLDQFRGDNYLLTNIGFLKSLGKLPLSGKDYYLGLWWEQGGVFESWDDFSLDHNISVGLLCPTVFGPISVGASYGEGDNQVFYIKIGQVF